jgi:cell division protein ZipA
MDAGTLRIILIVLGGAGFAAHYYWERRRAAHEGDDIVEEDAGLEEKREPRLGAWGRPTGGHDGEEDDVARDVLFRPVGAADSDGDSSNGQQAELPDEGPPQPLILQLSVVAPAGSRFSGPSIVRAAGRCGLEPGEMDIFHRYQGPAANGNLLFRMANLVEPGAFPFGAMADFESPGLSLFTEVAGAPGDPQVLDTILQTAKDLADELGGVVLDNRRRRLTADGENRLRQRVLALTGARSGLREQA